MNIKFNRPEHNREQNSSISFPINQDRNENKNTQAPAVEWARIAPNKVIVANAERAWLLEDTVQTNSSSSADQFLSQTMDSAGSIATTRQLLDGAIAAAKYAVNSDIRPPALTATRWVWRLAGAYHSSRFTSSLMEEAAKNFAATGRLKLANWALHKADEEKGHERLALLDINSLGYDAEAVVKILIPSASIAIVNYLSRSVKDIDPIDCIGCSYSCERLGTFIGEKYIQNIQALLPPNTYATRWLRVHSGIGAETEHVNEILVLVSSLTPKERIRVSRACYESTLIRFTSPMEGYISDANLKEILDPLRI